MRRKAIQNSAERKQREQEYKDKLQNMSKHNVGGLYDVRAIAKSRQFKEQQSHYSTEQALSFNILAGLKVTEIQKLRIDLGLLAGIIEKSSDCPSSYGSYQCYYSSTYNNRADYEYTFNYGLVLHATYDRITLGVRSTGESTQVLLGINF